MKIIEDTKLHVLIEAAIEAGGLIKEYYTKNNFVSLIKKDGTIATTADKEASKIITKKLVKHFPDIFVVSEEHENSARNTADKTFWLIDPLDGTDAFIDHNPNFTVNIALIHDHDPVFGLIYHPMHNILYYTNLDDCTVEVQAEQKPTRTLTRENQKNQECIGDVQSKIVIGRDSKLGKRFRKYFPNVKVEHISYIPSSIKFCGIADSTYDLYPRFGRTMEWDTAAGDAILRAVGGGVFDLNNNLLKYDKEHFVNPAFYATKHRKFSQET